MVEHGSRALCLDPIRLDYVGLRGRIGARDRGSYDGRLQTGGGPDRRRGGGRQGQPDDGSTRTLQRGFDRRAACRFATDSGV